MTPHEWTMLCLLSATGIGGIFYVRWLTRDTVPEAPASTNEEEKKDG